MLINVVQLIAAKNSKFLIKRQEKKKNSRKILENAKKGSHLMLRSDDVFWPLPNVCFVDRETLSSQALAHFSVFNGFLA
jgi:hypothetical protein